ncbi:unnamed protein product [Heligmosomoides polygyrus]|uniref:DUF4065 domain-containing protein n=1 Tax=Heligmosomoides polygyrus TaxID=6339 RepID=A0A183GUZ8_HELPZ|nr:unnamed protein product [Heligmosomoides polygyrus]
MSPYATFLSLEQQETLHELVVEARQQGADEPMVKNHIDKYVSKILSPNNTEGDEHFSTSQGIHPLASNSSYFLCVSDKKLPKKIYDLIDRYSGAGDVDYTKFYEENIRKLKRS